MSEETSNCTICRQPLGADGRCQHCDHDTHIWTIQDWRPLLTLSLVIVLGFSFTSLVVSSFREKQKALGAEYFAAGNRVMQDAGRDVRKYPNPAVDAFETALVYSPGNFEYRLKLTDALLASGANDEALVQLHGFLEQHPRDAQVNLKLARLEGHRHHVDDALRHYQDAVEGVWPEHTDPVPQRIGVRFELAKYLMDIGRHEQAEAALQSLAEVLPASPAEQERLAALYLSNGDAEHALSLYRVQLNVNKNDAAAIMGASQASFAAGSYATARRYLEELRPATEESQVLLTELVRMEALDPFARSATGRIRTERTMAAFRIAIERLAGCGVPFAEGMVRTQKTGNAKDPAQWSGFARWAEQLSPMMSERKLRGRDDVIESTMRFAFQAERAAQKGCGNPTLNDEALLLLARERMGAN